MKFSKIAKDKDGHVLTEGDVLLYSNKGVTSTGVVDKIVQRSRDQFPSIQVMNVTADWKGSNIKVQRSTINVETYKTGKVVHTSLLRDDVPVNAKVKEVQQEIAAKTRKNRRG